VERSALIASTITLVEIDRPGDRAGRSLAALARRIHARYEVAIGYHRGWDPRRVVVEHRVPGGALQVLDRVCRPPARSSRLRRYTDSLAYDAVNHEYRLRARLHVPWSWPDLPMRLAVGELGPDVTALRLSLHARRRLRYPARYFDAAHRALTDLESSH
jgi:hypothetical protein